MGNLVERSRLFNAFIILVFLAHCVQLVWNQPLIARQSPISPVAFNPDILEHNAESDIPRSEAVSASSQSSNQNNEDQRPLPESTSTTNSLCSIFRTFLDSSSVQCRVSRLNSGDVDSNALIQIRSPSNTLRAVQTPTDSRIDHFDPSEDENESGLKLPEEDSTKILQDKTTIILPDRQCPAGQRRDPRGYCRQVLHIRTYNGQQISVRPVRYYYRRFVAIPALHFILP